MLIEQTEQIAAFNEALAKAQGKMRHADMDGMNPHFSTAERKARYATLARVIDAVREPLSSEGISFQQFPGVNDKGQQVCITRLSLKDQWVQATMPIIGELRGMQAQGSAYTYARRYSLMMMSGVAADDDDDDAETAEGRQPQAAAAAKQGGRPQQAKPAQAAASALTDPGPPLTLEQAIEQLDKGRVATTGTQDDLGPDMTFAAWVMRHVATLNDLQEVEALALICNKVKPRGPAKSTLVKVFRAARERLAPPPPQQQPPAQ